MADKDPTTPRTFAETGSALEDARRELEAAAHDTGDILYHSELSGPCLSGCLPKRADRPT
jgi:hypothetical protein